MEPYPMSAVAGSWASLIDAEFGSLPGAEELRHAFRIGENWFLLPPGASIPGRSAELIRELPRARLPFTKPCFLGLANHRGDLIPIYDVAPLVDEEARGTGDFFLVLGRRDSRVGLRIDEIESLLLGRSPRRAPVERHKGRLADLGATNLTLGDRSYLELDYTELFAALVEWSR